MKNILVTGGAGFIGSHTCISLLEKGYEVTVVDSNINSSSISLKKLEIINQNKKIIFEKGDIRDISFMRRVFNKALKINKPIEAVIHFAGLKAVGESVLKPLIYWDANVYGSINLLKIMDEFKCHTMIFSSSATIYGNTESNPITESEPVNPNNPYGYTKATIESILKGIFESSKDSWRIANLRYFNPIGAHNSGLIGEDPSGEPNNLFPYICRVANGKYKRLKIFGKNWPTIDGTGIRDYIHVMDLADSHRSSLEFLLKNKPQYLNLNVGTGIGTSVLELVETFEKVNNCKIPYIFCDRRKGDVANVIADNKKIISLLKWHPKRNIQEMCRDGWRWQTLNPNGFKTSL